MNLKMRLERLCDSRSWAQIHFSDGTAIIGRVLRIGHDYVELECYGDLTNPRNNDYAKHLVPLSLVKLITVESSSFQEAERHRLNYLTQMESSQESTPELEK